MRSSDLVTVLPRATRCLLREAHPLAWRFLAVPTRHLARHLPATTSLGETRCDLRRTPTRWTIGVRDDTKSLLLRLAFLAESLTSFQDHLILVCVAMLGSQDIIDDDIPNSGKHCDLKETARRSSKLVSRSLFAPRCRDDRMPVRPKRFVSLSSPDNERVLGRLPLWFCLHKVVPIVTLFDVLTDRSLQIRRHCFFVRNNQASFQDGSPSDVRDPPRSPWSFLNSQYRMTLPAGVTTFLSPSADGATGTNVSVPMRRSPRTT